MNPRALSSLLLPTLLAAALAGCRKEEAPEPGFPNPKAAFDAAMVAVSQRDWKALQPILTGKGEDALMKDMSQWRDHLVDAKDGPVMLAEIRRTRPQTTDAEVEAARKGSGVDVWRFFLLVEPRPAKPKTTFLRLEPNGSDAQVGYEDVHGVERVVMLRKVHGRWYVERLNL